jgi:methanogenic corrinoid protein MtbC1
VAPPRGGTGRRLYTDEDIERLRLLKRAVAGGRRISDVAGLDIDVLRRMVNEDFKERSEGAALRTGGRVSPSVILEEVFRALEALDRHRLEYLLREASVEMSPSAFRQQLIVPLLDTIGARWQEGSLRIVHEHLASTIVRTFLTAPKNGQDRGNAPRIIVTTPAGQNHELGALMAAAVAEEIGWDVHYLGVNLPAEEIAAAVRQIGARAVALSLSFRENDGIIIEEMRRLRSLVDSRVPIFVGGRAAMAMRDRLLESGVRCPADLADYRSDLQAAVAG